MTQRERALDATRKALDQFDAPDVTVASLLRSCLRVASLRKDALALAILRFETVDLQTPKAGRTLFPEQVQALSAYLPYEQARVELHHAYEARIARMTLPWTQEGEEKIWGGSVAQLELSLSAIKHRMALLQEETAGLAPTEWARRDENEQISFQLEKTLSARTQLLERTKAFLFDFLLDAEAEMERGQTSASVFEETIRYVEETLGELAPDVLGELRAAEERLIENNPAAISQGLVSCRRVLKAIADAVYPAREEPVVGFDGKPRKVGDDQYINRLLQFAIERSGSRSANDLLQAGLDALGRRLQAVNALASRGVHANVPLEEANSCFTQTYLLAAEILRIRDNTSVRLAEAETEKNQG